MTCLGHFIWIYVGTFWYIFGIFSMAISGTDVLEVPTIYKVYIRPM